MCDFSSEVQEKIKAKTLKMKNKIMKINEY